jgi:hypothetical protein
VLAPPGSAAVFLPAGLPRLCLRPLTATTEGKPPIRPPGLGSRSASDTPKASRRLAGHPCPPPGSFARRIRAARDANPSSFTGLPSVSRSSRRAKHRRDSEPVYRRPAGVLVRRPTAAGSRVPAQNAGARPSAEPLYIYIGAVFRREQTPANSYEYTPRPASTSSIAGVESVCRMTYTSRAL